MSDIYPNQSQAGSEIIAYFYSGIDNVILIAYTQSGKTGTAKYVVQTLIKDGIPVNEICFICGMNDNDLLNQARHEFKSLLPEENILFSKQLQKIRVECKFSYVIIDESHYASNTDSQIDKFLRQNMTERFKTLSVSATPMAELAVSRDKSVGVVRLYPGPNYYGIADIFTNGLIYESIDITHNQEAFLDLVYDQFFGQQENGDLKYNIIRLPNQWYTKDLEDEINTFDMNIEFINHHVNFSERADDFNDYLRAAPERTTVIWIYGGLRAGKQLRTEHIGFVHDTWNSGPDTIAQSLLGRITGYNKAKDGVVCFTDMAAARLMLEWVKTGFDAAFIPSRSRAILNGYGGSSSPEDWVYHPPLIIELDRKNADYYRAAKLEHGNRYPYRETLITDLILSAAGERKKIEDIFDHYLPGKCGGLMALTEFNVKRSFHENWENNFSKSQKGLPSGNFLTHDGPEAAGYYYIYLNLHLTSPEYGSAVLLYKERKTAHNNCPVKYVSVNKRSRFKV